MTKKNSILCFFIALLAITSCSKSDDIQLSTLNSIDAFAINFDGVNEDDITYDLGNTITITVPYNTNLSGLITTITAATGATITPASGDAVDFIDGQAVPFTVTAEDGLSQKVYNVIINTRGEIGSGSRLKTYRSVDAWGDDALTTYSYAESNFVNEISQEVTAWGATTTTVYTLVYNDKNQVIERKSVAAKVNTVYEYNDNGQIITGTFKDNDVLTYTYTYTYDATSGNLVSEKRLKHEDDSETEIVFTIENGNVVIENKFGDDYVATYDDKNNPFKGIYPAAYAAINVGVQTVNTNNPITGTIADAAITYTYNTDDYPLTSSYSYFGGAATVVKTFVYY
jgi:hypothetical protein